MLEEILKAVPVVASSAIKFILGPIEGYALKLHFITTYCATVFGMMISVTAFTFFGNWLRTRIIHRLFKKPEKKEKKNSGQTCGHYPKIWTWRNCVFNATVSYYDWRNHPCSEFGKTEGKDFDLHVDQRGRLGVGVYKCYLFCGVQGVAGFY